VLMSLHVDASVLPIQLSAHLSATLYGLAEKAAETILRGE
jgi:choline dehydrogenase